MCPMARAETPAILGSIAAIAAIVVYARLSGPKKRTESDGMTRRYTTAETLRAWSVYIFILTLILVTGALCPPIEKFLKSNLVTSVSLPCLGSTFRFGWLSNAGLWLFAGSLAGGWFRASDGANCSACLRGRWLTCASPPSPSSR